MSERIVPATVLLVVGAIIVAMSLGAWRVRAIKGGMAAHSPLYKKDNPVAYVLIVGAFAALGGALIILAALELATGRP